MSGCKTYQQDEIEARLSASLPRWSYRDGFIRRKFETHGWKSTLMAINAVGHLAEAAWHHPDIHASYGSFEVRLQTHDAGGVTEKDFELAQKIEEVLQWRPESEKSATAGAPNDPRYAYIKYDR